MGWGPPLLSEKASSAPLICPSSYLADQEPARVSALHLSICLSVYTLGEQPWQRTWF